MSNRAERREQQFNGDVMTPAELAREDMSLMLEAALASRNASLVKQLKLTWTTPEWAREDRYKMVNFGPQRDQQFIVRPATPGKEVTRWEAIHNGQRKAWITGTLWEACIWLERSLVPQDGGAQAP